MKVAGTASSAHAMHVMGLAPPPTALVAAACTGKILNGSAPAAASRQLEVMPGLPPARHSAGGAGSVAAGVDGGGDQCEPQMAFSGALGKGVA